ncbi:MAG: tetratricopeptide repeat protein, partial [Pseudomonadota bacterium]
SDLSTTDIGEQLSASHLLEGSVRRRGDSVRVSATLVETSRGVQVWSEKYDHTMENVFAIQETIAEDIASALKVKLSGDEGAGTAPLPHDTYELYLRGRHLLSQRGAALPQAVAIFDAVTKQAPTYSDGWASLATALHVSPAYTGTPEREVSAKAISAAKHALSLSPDNASALAVMGAQRRRQGDWRGAEDAFTRALALEPSNISALSWYGEFLLSVGHFDEALQKLQRAKSIDPLAAYTSAGLGWALYFNGDNTGAARELDAAWNRFGLRVPYVWEGLYSLALDDGDYARARALITALPMPDPIKALHQKFVTAVETPSDKNIQNVQEAFAGLDALMPVPYYWRYEAFARLGLEEAALVAAEHAVAQGEMDNYQALFTPAARRFWASDKFADITEAIGLMNYWETTSWPPFCADAAGGKLCKAATH